MRYGKKQLQILVENSMSEDWISTNSQTCPNCSAAIEVYNVNFKTQILSYTCLFILFTEVGRLQQNDMLEVRDIFLLGVRNKVKQRKSI